MIDNGTESMMGQPNASDADVSPSRRIFLRTVGATMAAVTGMVLGSAPVMGADYETVTVPTGERETVTVPENGTLENKLYDITADGASIVFDMKGDSWTMRNVGVRGVNETGETFMHASVTDSSSEGVVENCYFGDGTTEGDGVGIWVDGLGGDAHRGTLVFDKLHIANFADNGIYATGPVKHMDHDAAGPIHIRNSFSHNNNISQFRIGSHGSSIENSVALVDSNVPDNEVGVNARGLWLRVGGENITIEDSAAVIRHSEGTSAIDATDLAQGRVTDTTIEGPVRGDENLDMQNITDEAPDAVPLPEGVPMTAEEAASGGASAGESTATPEPGDEASPDDEAGTGVE